jgi:hypothetical protein
MILRLQRAVSVLALSLMSLSSCVTMQTVQESCSTSSARRCIGPMRVPESKVADFRAAAPLAIDAIDSPVFRSELAAFIAAHGNDPDIRHEWAGWDAERIAIAMGRAIQGLNVQTTQSFGAWLDHTFARTVAYDGGERTNAPATFVRFGLSSWTPANIANTLAHEASHHAGLSHAESESGNWIAAHCEPPYLIGSIVEHIAAGTPLRQAGAYDCKRFFNQDQAAPGA